MAPEPTRRLALGSPQSLQKRLIAHARAAAERAPRQRRRGPPCDHVGPMRPRRSAQMAAAALGALALLTSTLAAESAKDGSYHGALTGSRASITISFQVSGG